MNRHSMSDEIRLPKNEEPPAPVTIFDGNGSIVRVVPATEFRRTVEPEAPRRTVRATAVSGARRR